MVPTSTEPARTGHCSPCSHWIPYSWERNLPTNITQTVHAEVCSLCRHMSTGSREACTADASPANREQAHGYNIYKPTGVELAGCTCFQAGFRSIHLYVGTRCMGIDASIGPALQQCSFRELQVATSVPRAYGASQSPAPGLQLAKSQTDRSTTASDWTAQHVQREHSAVLGGQLSRENESAHKICPDACMHTNNAMSQSLYQNWHQYCHE